MCLLSEPSAASRGRAAHARWPTSALAVGGDPPGALMAPMVASVASASMVLSVVLAARAAVGVVSDESAESAACDPESFSA